MPYKIKGNAVIKTSTGKVVGHSKNPKKYLRVLEAIKHGFKPTGKSKKKKSEPKKSFFSKFKGLM